MVNLKAGVDGGSTSQGLQFALQRQGVFYWTTVVPGSIVMDRVNRFLYLIGSSNSVGLLLGDGVIDPCNMRAVLATSLEILGSRRCAAAVDLVQGFAVPAARLIIRRRISHALY